MAAITQNMTHEQNKHKTTKDNIKADKLHHIEEIKVMYNIMEVIHCTTVDSKHCHVNYQKRSKIVYLVYV